MAGCDNFNKQKYEVYQAKYSKNINFYFMVTFGIVEQFLVGILNFKDFFISKLMWIVFYCLNFSEVNIIWKLHHHQNHTVKHKNYSEIENVGQSAVPIHGCQLVEHFFVCGSIDRFTTIVYFLIREKDDFDENAYSTKQYDEIVLEHQEIPKLICENNNYDKCEWT